MYVCMYIYIYLFICIYIYVCMLYRRNDYLNTVQERETGFIFLGRARAKNTSTCSRMMWIEGRKPSR